MVRPGRTLETGENSMSDLSVYVGDNLLNWFKGTEFDSPPAALYVALFTGDPEASGVEVTGTLNLTRQAAAFGAIASRTITNSAEINFGTANANGSANYVAAMSAASGGNVLSKKSISSVTITSGEKIYMAAGDLTFVY